MRKFVEYYTVPTKDGGQSVDRQCHKDGEECALDSEGSKYRTGSALFASEPGRQVGRFVLSVFNPASHHGLRGVRVILQRIPMRSSKVDMEIHYKSAVLYTSNVKMLQLQSPSVAPIPWEQINDIVVSECTSSRFIAWCMF